MKQSFLFVQGIVFCYRSSFYHPRVVIVAEHNLYGPDEQHMEGEDENAQKSDLVKKPPHVSNQSVGMANIDKSAEEDSQVRDSTYGI